MPGTLTPSKRRPPIADKRRLSEVARHVVEPEGITSTGWPAVRDTCNRLGWGFDGWQDGAGRLIMSKRADGSHAADTIVISIPRQVGKTYLIGCIVFALCLKQPGLKVIWTAHVKSTAAETFRAFDAMAQKTEVAPHVRQVLRGKGDEQVIFTNGSTIEFGARESGFGRGRTDVDVLVFDEGQQLSTDTLENMGAAQNVAANPLTFVMGTPPRPKDNGEFFTMMRQEAIDGESEGTLYIEFSADRNADPMDRAQWRKANPSFPVRTTERAMLRLRKKLRGAESWAREALGIWDEAQSATSPITSAKWTDCRAEEFELPVPDAKPVALAVDRWYDGSTSVAAIWRVGDDLHVELVAADRVDDPSGVVAFITERAGRTMPVFILSDSPAASMVADLSAAKVKVRSVNAADYGKACVGFLDAVKAQSVTHDGEPRLVAAVAGARKRDIGKAGLWGWDRQRPEIDISGLVAATLAHHGAKSARKARSGQSVFR